MNPGLLERDVAELSDPELVEVLAASERVIAAAHAAQLRALAEIAAREKLRTPEAVAKSWAREEVACALRVAGRTAEYRLLLGTELARMPAAHDMLARGELALPHVQRLTEAVIALTDAEVSAVVDRVLPGAEALTPASFARRVRRAVAALAPHRGEQAHVMAVTTRDLTYTALDHGMAEVRLLTAADAARHVYATLCDRARRHHGRFPDDCRTAAQLRADLMVALVDDDRPGEARPAARHPLIQVTVAASTLAGLDDLPGELSGHGPIPASLARAVAADPSGTWRRLLTDDAGALLDYGRRAYRPPAELARHVAARDRTCRFPTCNLPASTCEVDHVRSWQEGGTTAAANLQVLCRRHHHLKHEAGWRVTRRPDGSTEWTSPTGHRYCTPPPDPYPPSRVIRRGGVRAGPEDTVG